MTIHLLVLALVVVIDGVAGLGPDEAGEFLAQDAGGGKVNPVQGNQAAHQRSIYQLPLARLFPGVEGGGYRPGADKPALLITHPRYKGSGGAVPLPAHHHRARTGDSGIVKGERVRRRAPAFPTPKHERR